MAENYEDDVQRTNNWKIVLYEIIEGFYAVG